MPGHDGSPHWAVVDFDSEGDDVTTPPPNHRVYLDPWDSEGQGIIQTERPASSQEDTINSFAGEPVSASFYYVPTKSYDSGEEAPLPPPRGMTSVRACNSEQYSAHGRKLSRAVVPEVSEQVVLLSGERPMRDRRRSKFIDEPVYIPHPMAPMMCEPVYGRAPPRARTRLSLSLPHAEYMMTHVRSRRLSRLADAYEQYIIYESLSPEYEDWARPFPNTAPDNFHLSRYGHLQIDYSFSWHSLDRLIRNQ